MAKRKSVPAPGPKDFNPVMIPIADLNKAEWNYKTDDEAMAAKLAANIKRNGILQASVVYEAGGKIIVLDGNHRLDAYRKLGIKAAPCLNMGPISEAAAKRIAIELNETHFESDPMRLAETIKELLAEFDDLEVTFPFTGDQIQGFGDLIDSKLDWNDGEAADAEPQIDRAAELNKKWKVKTGDMFGLGAFTVCPKCGKVHNLDKGVANEM